MYSRGGMSTPTPCIMQISEITTLGLLQDLHEKLHGEVLAGAGILHLQAEGEDLGVAAHLRQTVQLSLDDVAPRSYIKLFVF